jgi:hypothetical protein
VLHPAFEVIGYIHDEGFDEPENILKFVYMEQLCKAYGCNIGGTMLTKLKALETSTRNCLLSSKKSGSRPVAFNNNLLTTGQDSQSGKPTSILLLALQTISLIVG